MHLHEYNAQPNSWLVLYFKCQFWLKIAIFHKLIEIVSLKCTTHDIESKTRNSTVYLLQRFDFPIPNLGDQTILRLKLKCQQSWMDTIIYVFLHSNIL